MARTAVIIQDEYLLCVVKISIATDSRKNNCVAIAVNANCRPRWPIKQRNFCAHATRQHRRNVRAQWRADEAHSPAPRRHDETLKLPCGDSCAGVPDQSLPSLPRPKKSSAVCQARKESKITNRTDCSHYFWPPVP